MCSVYPLFVVVFIAYLVDADLLVRHDDHTRKVHAFVKKATALEVEKQSRTPSYYSKDNSLTDCIARHAKWASKSQRLSQKQFAMVLSDCATQAAPILEKISRQIVDKTGVEDQQQSIRQSRKGRRILKLFSRSKQATLQYVFSRLRKVLANVVGPGEFDVGRPTCELDPRATADEFVGNARQTRLVRKILKLLENADEDTVQLICDRLEKLLKPKFTSARQKTSSNEDLGWTHLAGH